MTFLAPSVEERLAMLHPGVGGIDNLAGMRLTLADGTGEEAGSRNGAE